jgi:hypothetical protein
MDNFTIYSISSEGEIFYIGRTCDLKRRKNEHMSENKGNTYKSNKIKKLRRENKEINFNILHENLTYEQSIELEIKEIKEHKEKGYILANLTDGGEGTFGHKPIFTDEWKNNLKMARKLLFNDGYEVANKGKTLEELIGKEKAKEQKERIGKKISDGIKSGLIKHNKGKKLEELVGIDRATELKEEIRVRAKNTFTGIKQNNSHINKRISKQIETKSNWSIEKREEIRQANKLNGAKAHKNYNFIVDGFNHYGTWKSLSPALREEQGIIVSPDSLSQFYRGKIKTLKCGIKTIKIQPLLND